MHVTFDLLEIEEMMLQQASLVPRPFCVSFPGRAGRAGGRETEDDPS